MRVGRIHAHLRRAHRRLWHDHAQEYLFTDFPVLASLLEFTTVAAAHSCPHVPLRSIAGSLLKPTAMDGKINGYFSFQSLLLPHNPMEDRTTDSVA